jgi:hypothetical protein
MRPAFDTFAVSNIFQPTAFILADPMDGSCLGVRSFTGS